MIIVDIEINGTVALSKRNDPVNMGKTKRSDVRKILAAARDGYDAILVAWRNMSGNA